MADGGARAITLETVSHLRAITREDWNGLANPPDAPYDPFISWEFLEALEASGCVSPATGWSPAHLIARDETGAAIGAAPLYLKTHSYGEYVFDHAWADALHRAGGRYYPKLQCASPFTPVTGRRLLTRDEDVEAALCAGAIKLAQGANASSLHVTFLPQDSRNRLARLGLLPRTGVQFHWTNQGYRGFDDFLAALSANKRKCIRRERRDARAGLEIKRLTGRDLTESAWDFFFDCYMDTGERKWGQPYLNRKFFSLLGERIGERIVLFVAEEAGEPIAAALNLLGSDALYGRYWGRLKHRDFLHFELCYYAAIDLAIELGLSRVEAGAQGEHKLARGYAPAPTYSAHWIAHPGLARAVADYLARETPAMAEEIEFLAEHTPFKKLEC